MKYAFKKTRNCIIIPILDTLGYAFFPFIWRINKRFPSRPKKILIVRLDHIGDFVCTLPLFKNVKAQFPEAKLTILVNPLVCDLAEKLPYVDRVITLSPFWLRHERRCALKQLKNTVRILRQERFDLGIDARGDLFSIILMFLGRVKYRLGYGITGGGFLLHKENNYNRNIHAIDRNLELLEGLTAPIKFNFPEVCYGEDDKKFVENLLNELKFEGQNAVVVHPYSGTEAKQWPQARFRELIDGLTRANLEVFIVGNKSDKITYSGTYDMRGKLSLGQLVYLFKRIGAFVGLDSGPANIAASLGVHAVVICSGTNNPQLWIPQGENVSLIYHDVACKPCEEKNCPKDKHYCMEEITVQEVMENINSKILKA